MDLTLHICQLYHTNRTWHTYMSAAPVENIKLNLNYNLSTSPNPNVVEATRCAATLEITGSSIISTRYVLPPSVLFHYSEAKHPSLSEPWRHFTCEPDPGD